MMKLRLSNLIVCSILVSASLGAHSITLEEVIENAIKVDPMLRLSKLNLQATEENIAIASSRLLPQVSLQGSSNQLSQTTTQDIAGGSSVSRSFTGPSVNHQLVIRQALIRPKERSALKYAELQTQYTTIKFKLDLADLKLRVVNSWIDLLGSKQIVEAFERPLPLMKKAADQAKAKFEKGDGTIDIAMEAVAQYQSAISMHIQAVEVWKARQAAFERLTGIPAETVKEKKLPLNSYTNLSADKKTEIWKSFRDISLELQLAHLQEQMQLERVRMAEADHKPSLDLLASFNLAQNDATSTQGYQYRNKQVGVQYLVPLYSGGGTASSVKQANLQYNASIEETLIIGAKLENDFDNTWSLMLGAEARQKAMNDLLGAAREQAKSNLRAYELGVNTLTDLASAEQLVSRKYVDLISGNQEYMRNLYKLKKLYFNFN